MATKQTEHKILVRLPVELHAQLKLRAEAERRSVTGQVVYLIEQDVKAFEAEMKEVA